MATEQDQGLPGATPPETLAGFAAPPEPFFSINKDRLSYTADWGRIEALAQGVQQRPIDVPLQMHEALALAIWLVRAG